MDNVPVETAEVYGEKSDSCIMQSQWLQTTISGVNEKLKGIVDILEDDDIDYDRRKDGIAQIVNDLCRSYCSLAYDYEHLKSTSNNHDNSQPESTIENAESGSEGVTSDLVNHLKAMSDTLVPGNKVLSLKDETKFSRLLLENSEMQVELIRRNCEKREMIMELRDQVSKLKAEKVAMKRKVSYYERKVEVAYPSQRGMLRGKFFTCSS